MKSIKYILIIGLVSLFLSCEDGPNGPIKSDSVAPGPVSNATVENMSGASKINFEVPTDVDLLYVKATFTRQGKECHTIVSGYQNYLIVDGFAMAKDVDVTLEAFDRSENVSTPVVVTASPETPPFLNVAASVRITPDFGGGKFIWDNPTESNLTVALFVTDTVLREGLDNTTILNNSQEKGSLTVRGYEPDSIEMFLRIGDRWDNYSDLKGGKILPLYEIECDKELFDALDLDNDANWGSWQGVTVNLWNGIYNNTLDIGHTLGGNDWPPTLSIDLGDYYDLSRWVWYQRRNFPYTHGNPQTWEVYKYIGTGEPSPSGDWSEWEFVQLSHAEKPSGLPGTQMTEEDEFDFLNGHESTFDDPETFLVETLQNTRYVRLKCVKTWDGATYVDFGELSFYGQNAEQN